MEEEISKSSRVKSSIKQIKYINDLQSKLNNSKSTKVVFDPYTELPDSAGSFYLKPVIVLAPDFIKGFSPICYNCNGILSSNGWVSNHRYVHGLKHGYYILQKKFKCTNLNCSVQKCDALSLFKNGALPYYVSCRYPIVAAGETVFHRDLAGNYYIFITTFTSFIT